MTTPEERLAELTQRIDALGAPRDIRSAEELGRAELARFAADVGAEVPVFRSSVRLRFEGPSVVGHDLRGVTAGTVLARFAEAVKQAGADLHIPPPSLELYLSPTIGAGSTVLELFGVPREDRQSTLGQDLVDAPVDIALDRVFELLNSLQTERPDEADGGLSPALGKRLFQLASALIDDDVDLDLTWLRPSGRATAASLPRERARLLRDRLDHEVMGTIEREVPGVLVAVSTTGTIGVRPDNAQQPVTVDTAEHDPEKFRRLWARRVVAVWQETTVSHPQRDAKKVTRTLVSIREAPETPTLEV